MSNEVKVISANQLVTEGHPQLIQTGDDNVAIPNYGTIYLNIQQQSASLLPFGGNIYIPAKVDRKYYNIFVLGGEEFDMPYIKVPRERSLNEYMSQETKNLFGALTEENIVRIKTMPSLFMAENNQYGQADDNQNVIYGFIPDIKIYENYIKVYYFGYGLIIPQKRLNELLDELQLSGTNKFNEMNRTHWSIKQCDLIQELLEAGIQVPVFTIGDSH